MTWRTANPPDFPNLGRGIYKVDGQTFLELVLKMLGLFLSVGSLRKSKLRGHAVTVVEHRAGGRM